ncbi:MAG: hypothetical protein LBR40_01930 [Bacilli bacterium]|jgi:4-hydroxybutyrate CoA-transferase|nr:hypothetical protein [Bacilli bacterium]
MLVGVKYCGGCQSTYDRVAAYKKIENALDVDIEIVSDNENKIYDLLIVICGCRVRCPDIDKYQFKDFIYIYQESDLDDKINYIKDLLHK